MDLQARTLVVFSHPNHELSIFGTLQRLKPKIVFLTDGGGPQRIAETADGLRRIGLFENSVFLNHTEQSFYDALIRKSSSFFKAVSDEVRTVSQLYRPEQVLCDAVEFYNPVHDMTLPITMRAMPVRFDRVVEVPLVYQKPGQGEIYCVQSFPQSRGSAQILLSEEERASKREALADTYTILMKTMGPILVGSPHTLEREVFSYALSPMRDPGKDYVLRYDDRAQILKKSGKIEDMILREEHFLPVVRDLF